MKQNDLHAINQDLLGSAQTISDMLSRPDIVHQDYNNDAVENAYVFATSEGAKTKVDWEKGTWYVAPNDDGFI